MEDTKKNNLKNKLDCLVNEVQEIQKKILLLQRELSDKVDVESIKDKIEKL